MKALILAVMLLSTTALGHEMTPSRIEQTVFTEVNTYEFTLVNRNDFTAYFNVVKYDAEILHDADGNISHDSKGRIRFKTVGESKLVSKLKYPLGKNETHKIYVDFRAAPAKEIYATDDQGKKIVIGYKSTLTPKVICTEMVIGKRKSTVICSGILMERY